MTQQHIDHATFNVNGEEVSRGGNVLDFNPRSLENPIGRNLRLEFNNQGETQISEEDMVDLESRHISLSDVLRIVSRETGTTAVGVHCPGNGAWILLLRVE